MKVVIHTDQGNRQAVEQEYQRLIVLDPEVESVEDADMWMRLLQEDLSDLRAG